MHKSHITDYWLKRNLRRNALVLMALFLAISIRMTATDLSICHSGDTVDLSWPLASANSFYVQFTTNQSPPYRWINASEPTTNGTMFVVTDNATEPSRFYRLKQWEILFDGTSTDAFRGYHQTNFPSASWIVTTNGELQSVSNATTIPIITTNQYSDFELVWEWKTTTKGNSGVQYRCTEEYAYPEYSAPEFQLLDDASYPSPTGSGGIGAVWGLISPTNKVLVSTGQWNQCRIIVQGNYVQHWLNGRRVVAYYLNSASFTKLVANSKFNQYPNFAKACPGHIVLRHDGTQSWFRNVKIRQLPAQ